MRSRLLVIGVLVMLALTACGGGTAVTPRVASAVVTNDRASTVAKEVFSPDTTVIYVLFTVADVPQGTTMKSVWIAESAQGFQPNEKMDEATLTVGGSVTSGNFSFRRSQPWPVGSYRVDLYLAEKLAHTARFKVEGTSANPEGLIPAVGPAPAAGSPGRLGAILFARGQSNNDPVDPSPQFEEGVRAIYAFFNFADLEGDDTVTGVWTRGDEKLLEQQTKLSEIFGANPSERGHLWFSITFPNGATPGTYKLDLSINGTPAQSGSITVVPQAGAPAPATAAGTSSLGPVIFARGESNTQPVGRADRFEKGIKAVYAFFNFAGLKPEDVVSGAWYRGTEKILEQQVKMADIFQGSPREKGHLWFSIKFDEGAPAGVYRLDLSVNGTPAVSGNFAVD